MSTEWHRETVPACSPARSCKSRQAASAKRIPPAALEEGRLNDMPLRENSIEGMSACYRWTEMLDEYRTGSPRTGRGPATAGPLVRFHAAHKLTLIAHSPAP